jgi:hypothetical protein
MANIDRQKLSCLALTRLLELPPPMMPIILERLQDYFAMWTSVINEMIGGREDDGGDNLIWLANDGNDYEGPDDVRRRLHAGSDPVHTIHTLNFVKERLGQVVAICGGEETFHRDWAVNVDNDVLIGFQNLGTKKDGEAAFWQRQE